MEYQHLTKERQGDHRESKRVPAHSAQHAAPVHPILQLQRTAGNRAIGQMIQTKLKISQPGDKYEREADRVAEQVMRMSDSKVSGMSPGSPAIQRKCAPRSSGHGLCHACVEEEEKEFLQAKETPGHTPEVTPAIAANISSLKGGGQPLPRSVRSFFEPRFGVDFGNVRVHTDARAVQMARSMNARAFTVGRDLVFDTGEFIPQTNEGQRLLAHELMHVVQQGRKNRCLATTVSIEPTTSIITLRRAEARLPVNCTNLVANVLPRRNPRDEIAMAHDWAIWIVDRVLNILRNGQAGPLASANFGNTSRIAIQNRFETIMIRLSQGLGIYKCVENTNPHCDSEEGRRFAAFEECPSTRMGTCGICPSFFRQTSLPRALTLIHEAAHAAGACSHTGTLNNANAYENFARGISGRAPVEYEPVW